MFLRSFCVRIKARFAQIYSIIGEKGKQNVYINSQSEYGRKMDNCIYNNVTSCVFAYYLYKIFSIGYFRARICKHLRYGAQEWIPRNRFRQPM